MDRAPVIGITGTGGAGKLARRRLVAIDSTMLTFPSQSWPLTPRVERRAGRCWATAFAERDRPPEHLCALAGDPQL